MIKLSGRINSAHISVSHKQPLIAGKFHSGVSFDFALSIH